jgi:2-methylcitrate dehydratase PrpD
MRGQTSRRRALQAAAGVAVAALAARGNAQRRGAAPNAPPARGADSRAEPARLPDLTGRLARYLVEARTRVLPAGVAAAAKHRILDTLAAIVSGARLPPGEAAIRYVRALGGTPEACVATTDIVTTAVNAALANGMCAHADESDDFHPFTKAHPGCSVVPAALAMAERERASGPALLGAVVVGYDVCCSFLMALGPDLVRGSGQSAEGVSATLGASAAAAAVAGLDERGMRYVLSYAAQQTSGVWSWERDADHIEKAFDFGGMGARNGVTAATMVAAGFTGVIDALDAEPNVWRAHSARPSPEELVADLGARFYIEETAIKTYPVGYPIQAPLDAFLSLQREHALTPANVEHVVVRLPTDGARIVDGSAMPDVNVQHIIAVALVEGRIDFANSHSRELMSNDHVLAARKRVELVADPALMDSTAPRSGRVEVTLTDGRRVERFVKFAPGTPENPLDESGVAAKARSLIAPVLGAAKTEALIAHIGTLEQIADVRELRTLLTP